MKKQIQNAAKNAQGLGGKRGAGVTGYGVPGCGKRGVWWKTRGLVENAGSGGKHGVWWKTRGLGGKHGVNRIFLAKIRSLNFVILNCNENQFHFSA